MEDKKKRRKRKVKDIKGGKRKGERMKEEEMEEGV